MIQYYAPDIASTGLLPEDESAHCVRVTRHKVGDTISVIDGKGMRYTCVITDAHPKHTAVNIVESVKIPKTWKGQLTLAVAPTKNIDRMEWLVEKATEMGVDRIVPLLCEHSERKVLKPERLERIMVSAAKQSLKAALPELLPMTSVRGLAGMQAPQKMVGYCSDEYERKDFSDIFNPGEDTIIAIGPEGDFSPEEIELLAADGFVPVTFGQSRLRTETAGLYGVAAFHTLNQLNKK